jgi:hypothetical protein
LRRITLTDRDHPKYCSVEYEKRKPPPYGVI